MANQIKIIEQIGMSTFYILAFTGLDWFLTAHICISPKVSRARVPGLLGLMLGLIHGLLARLPIGRVFTGKAKVQGRAQSELSKNAHVIVTGPYRNLR